MTALPSYPAYRDSGVPWLGDVPAHWSVLPNRTLFIEVNQRDFTHEELLSVTIGRGVIRQADLLHDTSKRDSSNADKSNYKLVVPRDIVYNKMRAWQGAIGVSDYRGIVSPAYVVVRPRGEHNPRFFHYLLRTPGFASEAERWSYGITSDQWSLRAEDFKQIYCPLPPPAEQAAIVRYLDHMERRIRRYMRAKRRLLALLAEQKQAIIHQAVTRGLDADAPRKPSGVAWLGEVPAHWEKTRLKFEASHIVDCLHATPEYDSEGEFPAIRTADVEPGKLRLASARKVSRQQYELWTSRLAPKAGDILYTREGERYGLAALVPDDINLCISQRMMVFRIRDPQYSDYLMWQLNCQHVFFQAAADIMGATAPHVNVERIRNYVIVLPPPHEQIQIAAHIASECSEVEKAIDSARRQIDLLREYRTRLIADVVTGQVDVRAAAAALPVEIDDADEPLADGDAEAEGLGEDATNDGEVDEE